MANIFITRQIQEAGILLLKEKGHTVQISGKDGILTKEELISALKEKKYDAVLCLLTDKIDGQIFDAVPNAKIFANYAVGFDNIDVVEARKRGIIVTNTPDVLTDTVAEHAFALMLALAHRIVEGDTFIRDGKFKEWAPMAFLGTDLSGKILGILGAGRIGSRVAYHGQRSFDMNVIYFDVKRNKSIEKEAGARFKENIDDVLKEADFVSVHVPLLSSTRHLLNFERLSLMKPNAYLVNTSRGPIVDEVALVQALKSGVIRGAALDVFENEPMLAPELKELKNVVLTPHIASATEETRSKMSELAAKNIIAVLEGREALTPAR